MSSERRKRPRGGNLIIPPGASVDIGANARRLREAKGITIPEVADRMHLDFGNISKLERGQRRWNEDNIFAYAAAIGVRPAELLSEDDLPPIRPALAELLTTSTGKMLSPGEIAELRRINCSGEPTLEFYVFALGRIRSGGDQGGSGDA